MQTPQTPMQTSSAVGPRRNWPRRNWLRATLLTLAALAVTGGPAFAAYPDKPLRLVIPYPPGGATDVIGRIIAARLGEALGQQVVVENRGGAGGNIGAEVVAKSAPDGYTLLMGALTSHSTMATLEKGRLRYDRYLIDRLSLFLINTGRRDRFQPDHRVLHRTIAHTAAGPGCPRQRPRRDGLDGRGSSTS